MDEPELELDRARDVLAEAGELRDALSLLDPATVTPAFAQAAARNLDQLISLAEVLLAERQRFLSRLHRTPAVSTFAAP